MDTFNRFFRFLFISSTINSLLSIRKTKLSQKPELAIEALNAKSIYKKQIRRYLGLGFLLSFIPGTEAFKSREALVQSIFVLEANVALHGSALYVIFRPFFILYSHFIRIYQNPNELPLRINPEGLEPLEKAPDGLNPLNPFFYVLHFFSYLLMQVIHRSHKSADLLSSPLKYLIIGLDTLARRLLEALLFIIFILFIITELVLNSLNTLLIEPFKFAFEVIVQLGQTWDFEFAYLPTDEANKLNNLIEAVANVQLEREPNSNVKTSKYTLILVPAKLIKTIENHRNSYFFKQNKDTDLFQKTKPEIREAYNLPIVITYLMQTQILNGFPTEIIQFIFSLCLELNSVEPSLSLAKDDESEDRVLEI